MPMRFSTSMSSWISNVLSKLNRYSNLQEGAAVGAQRDSGQRGPEAPAPTWGPPGRTARPPRSCPDHRGFSIRRAARREDSGRGQLSRGHDRRYGARTYLSLEMLQSMTVLLLVFTMMKGRRMTEFGGGGLPACCSARRFLRTRFLKAIC